MCVVCVYLCAPYVCIWTCVHHVKLLTLVVVGTVVPVRYFLCLRVQLESLYDLSLRYCSTVFFPVFHFLSAVQTALFNGVMKLLIMDEIRTKWMGKRLFIQMYVVI